MTQKENNLYLRLNNWALGQDENFVTEAFAHLMRHLLEHSPDAGMELLRRVTGRKLTLNNDEAAQVGVLTQTTVDKKRPDIEIRLPRRLIYIEVKVDAWLGTDQLKNYLDRLEASGVASTCLVLLTRYQAFWPRDQKPDSVARWYQVADWLEEFAEQDLVSGEPDRYLVLQFLEFLKERKMTIDKVGSELAEGLKSMRGLLTMAWEAAVGQGLKPRYAAIWNWLYLDLNNHKYFLGIWLDEPSVLRFRTGNVEIDRERCDQESEGRPFLDDGKQRWENSVDLASDESGFLNMSKDEQFRFVEDFVKKSLDVARRVEKRENGPLDDTEC